MQFEERPEDRFIYVAHFWGATFACLEFARPAALDAGELAAAKEHVLGRMDRTYQVDFKRAEETARSLYSSASSVKPEDRARMSTYVPLPHEREKNRVALWLGH
jgi:hypothetical protein